jgi:hypothetical protein
MNESRVASLDLFGHPQPQGRARPVFAEAAALHEVLAALRAHPRVCWAQRLNTGATRVGRRFVRFGFPGCPDVLGQLQDGRPLAVEVKGPRVRLRPDQKVVLIRVADAGGVAVVARSLRGVVAALGPLDMVVASPCADRGACGGVGLFGAPRYGA